jgi:tRNA-dihydrouridine synthase
MTNFWKELKKPAVGLAPMDGVTDEPMRQIQVKIAKPDVMYTEFISAEGFIRNPKAFERTLTFKENEKPLVVQIFGYTPKAFYETVAHVSGLGFNGVDLNMGCPSRKVLGKGAGGALIGNYALAGKIIEASLKALQDSKSDLPLSVKTRIGQKTVITEEWIEFLTGFPFAEISLHGRLLSCGLTGEVYWEEINKAAQIAERKNIVFFGNGGVKSITEAFEKSQKYHLDGILIGKAALGNPWVFKSGYQPTKEDIIETILEHARLAENFFPPERFVTIMKHFSWYPRGFNGSKKLKLELLKTRNLKEVEEVISSFNQAQTD